MALRVRYASAWNAELILVDLAGGEILHEVQLLITGENDDGAKKPHVDCYRCSN